DERYRDARFPGRTGTRRHNDGLGLQRQCLRRGESVIPVDEGLGAQLARVLDKVVGKAVVVVENEKHPGMSPVRGGGPRRESSRAAAEPGGGSSRPCGVRTPAPSRRDAWGARRSNPPAATPPRRS